LDPLSTKVVLNWWFRPGSAAVLTAVDGTGSGSAAVFEVALLDAITDDVGKELDDMDNELGARVNDELVLVVAIIVEGGGLIAVVTGFDVSGSSDSDVGDVAMRWVVLLVETRAEVQADMARPTTHMATPALHRKLWTSAKS
jgi:hypothetical protein